jgi:hypothetical protein
MPPKATKKKTPRVNTLRSQVCVSARTQTGETGEISKTTITSTIPQTPEKRARISTSTRLPIEIECYNIINGHPHTAKEILITSEERLRSTVRGTSYQPFSHWKQAKIAKIPITSKKCSVTLDYLGTWTPPRAESPKQNAVMEINAHTCIVAAEREHNLQHLSLRAGSSAAEQSHWLHLIGYSLSAENPQNPDNLVAGSAGANYDHIIFENTVVKIAANKELIHTGTYTVIADCINEHVALKINCLLDIKLKSGAHKLITFIFDPTKPKLTDAATAKRDENTIFEFINEFIRMETNEPATSPVTEVPDTDIKSTTSIATTTPVYQSVLRTPVSATPPAKRQQCPEARYGSPPSPPDFSW